MNILRVYVNGRIRFVVTDTRRWHIIKLLQGEVIDAIVMKTRDFEEFEVEETSFYRFGLTGSGKIIVERV
jgi:hypothetical protein